MKNTTETRNRATISFRSDTDYLRIKRLSELMGCSISSIASLAVEKWLRDNYFEYRDYYSKEL